MIKLFHDVKFENDVFRANCEIKNGMAKELANSSGKAKQRLHFSCFGNDTTYDIAIQIVAPNKEVGFFKKFFWTKMQIGDHTILININSAIKRLGFRSNTELKESIKNKTIFSKQVLESLVFKKIITVAGKEQASEIFNLIEKNQITIDALTKLTKGLNANEIIQAFEVSLESNISVEMLVRDYKKENKKINFNFIASLHKANENIGFVEKNDKDKQLEELFFAARHGLTIQEIEKIASSFKRLKDFKNTVLIFIKNEKKFSIEQIIKAKMYAKSKKITMLQLNKFLQEAHLSEKMKGNLLKKLPKKQVTEISDYISNHYIEWLVDKNIGIKSLQRENTQLARDLKIIREKDGSIKVRVLKDIKNTGMGSERKCAHQPINRNNTLDKEGVGLSDAIVDEIMEMKNYSSNQLENDFKSRLKAKGIPEVYHENIRGLIIELKTITHLLEKEAEGELKVFELSLGDLKLSRVKSLLIETKKSDFIEGRDKALKKFIENYKDEIWELLKNSNAKECQLKINQLLISSKSLLNNSQTQCSCQSDDVIKKAKVWCRKYQDTFVVEFSQGANDSQEILGEGVCLAWATRLLTHFNRYPHASIREMGSDRVTSLDRIHQAAYQMSKKIEKKSTHLIPENMLKKQGQMETLLFYSSVDRFREALCNNFDILALSNGGVKLGITGHVVLMRLDLERNIFLFADPDLGTQEFKLIPKKGQSMEAASKDLDVVGAAIQRMMDSFVELLEWYYPDTHHVEASQIVERGANEKIPADAYEYKPNQIYT